VAAIGKSAVLVLGEVVHTAADLSIQPRLVHTAAEIYPQTRNGPRLGRSMAQAVCVSVINDRHQLQTIVSQRGPVVLLRDVDAAGVSRAVVRRMVDRGELTRLAKAAFAPTEVIESASSWEVFRLKSVAFGRSSGPEAFLTGAAAAAVLRLPMISEPPDLPTVIRPGNARLGHDHTPYGRSRHGHLPPHHRTMRDGVATVSPAYCVVDIARHFGPQDGLVVADAVLASGISREVLAGLLTELQRYPGIETARWVVERADPRAESPLETLGRMAFLGAGLAPPISNAWIPVRDHWYRADHLLPDAGVILEADGAVKYDNRSDASLLVDNDRHRERNLRSLNFGIARYGWSVAVRNPAEIIRRAREAERLRNGQAVPTCWTLTSPWAH